MITYLHPETSYEVSSISARNPIHINIDLREHSQPPTSTSITAAMLSNLIYVSLSTLTHTLIHTLSIVIFLALLLVTYVIYTIRFLSNLTGLTTLLSYLWTRFPTILRYKVKNVYEERRELRHKYAEERTERLRERNLVGGKEKEQIREAMRRVAWKRGVGKMDYGIDLAEDSKAKSQSESKKSEVDKNKDEEIEEWIEDEVVIQDPAELQEELEKLEMRADIGKRAGYWDEEQQAKAQKAARILLRNGEVEEFPRFEDMDTRE